jgi:beta-lactamase class A
VIDVEAGAVLLDVDAGAVLPTASVGKVLLLVEVARRVHAGELDPAEPLPRTPADAVGDSGLWQHLQVPALPVADLAVLVGAVSDNLATNVLLRRVGLDAVAATAASLGLERTALHDVVRDVRTPVDPPALSSGSADELARLFTRLAAGEVLGPEVSATVNGWLATGTDLSMVAGALGLDPLAHTAADRGVVLRNKTGTDRGARADVGWVRAGGATLAYAVLAAWAPDRDERDAVLAAMRALGAQLRDRLRAA